MKALKVTALSFLMALLFIVQAKAQDAALGKSVNQIIDNYIGLKNALINADGAAAQNNAKELLAAINAIPTKGMSSTQLNLWNKYEAKLQYDSRHISEVDRVPHQREHFA